MPVMRRVKWLVDFAIDYGSIALVSLIAAIFFWGAIEHRMNPADLPPELSGVSTIFGVLLALLAVKLWRDVRQERHR